MSLSLFILDTSSNYDSFFLCGYGPLWPVLVAICLLGSGMDPCRLRLGQFASQQHSPQWPLDVQARGPRNNRPLGSICKPSNYHRCSWESTNWCSCGSWICMESRNCCCICIIIEEHHQFLQADGKWKVSWGLSLHLGALHRPTKKLFIKQVASSFPIVFYQMGQWTWCV